MDSILAAIYVGPCIRIELFGYQFGGCVVSGGYSFDPSGFDWIDLYFGPFGNTSVPLSQLPYYLVNWGLVIAAGLTVRYIVKNRLQKKKLNTDRDLEPALGAEASPSSLLRQIMELAVIAKKTFLSAVMLALFIVFAAYMLPGIICGFFIRGRFEIPISMGAAGGLFVFYRFMYFNPDHNIVYPNDGYGMILNWVVGSAIFLAGLRIPRYFREGFISAGVGVNSRNQQNKALDTKT